MLKVTHVARSDADGVEMPDRTIGSNQLIVGLNLDDGIEEIHRQRDLRRLIGPPVSTAPGLSGSNMHCNINREELWNGGNLTKFYSMY